MPRKQYEESGDVIKTITINKKAWADLQVVAMLYHTSRTAAVNRAIDWMVKERTIPGYKKREV